MIKFYFYIALFLFFMSCGQSPDNNDTDTPVDASASSMYSNSPYEAWTKPKQIVRYNTDNIEISRHEYEYDNQGKEISNKYYQYGKLRNASRNYEYTDNRVSYFYDFYLHDTITDMFKVTMVYDSDKRLLSETSYDIRKESNTFRDEYRYDDKGRKTGLRKFLDGKLYREEKDFNYVKNTAAYLIYEYMTTEPSVTRVTETYFDKNFMYLKTHTNHISTSEQNHSDYQYDKFWRETSYKHYSLNKLVHERGDYVYNENTKTVSFYENSYINGKLDSSVKVVKIYY